MHLGAPPTSLQYDVHLPLLTVRETLAFAGAALWASGAKNDNRKEFERVRWGALAVRDVRQGAARGGRWDAAPLQQEQPG